MANNVGFPICRAPSMMSVLLELFVRFSFIVLCIFLLYIKPRFFQLFYVQKYTFSIILTYKNLAFSIF